MKTLLSYFKKISKFFKKAQPVFSGGVKCFRFVHHHTAKRPHQYLQEKVGWYRKWHTKKYHHHVHFGILAVYIVSVLFSALTFPGNSLAAYQGSASWNADGDFTNNASTTGGATTLTGVKVAGGDVSLNDPIAPMATTLGSTIGFSSMAIKADGTFWGTGDNTSGQLGTGDYIARQSWTNTFSGAKAGAFGSGHTLILKNDGTVWGVGNNGSGQLGLGDASSRLAWTQISGLSNVRTLAASADGSWSFAIKNDGTLWATGDNSYGQLGFGAGDTAQRTIWTQVTSISDVKEISAGGSHSVAIKNDGTVWVTGRNNYGQLGQGDTTDRQVWTQVAGFTGATSVSTNKGGNIDTYVVKNGEIWGAGQNSNGELGIGNSNQQTSFVKATSVSGVVSVTGGAYHSLAIKNDGTLWVTGLNYHWQLGLNDLTSRNVYTQNTNISRVSAVTAGYNSSFALKADGTLQAFGYDGSGQLGNGQSMFVNNWTHNTLGGVRSVANIDGLSSMAIKTDNTVWGLGYGYNGGLGNGTTYRVNKNWVQGQTSYGVPITNVSKVVAAGTGDAAHSMLIKSDGTLWGTGYNSCSYHNLGTASCGNKSYWTQTDITSYIPPGTTVVDVAIGYLFTIAVVSNGDVWVVGYNNGGQLGVGDATTRTVWTKATTLSGITSIAAGGSYALALKSDGTVYATGSNGSGQLGLGDSISRTSWTVVTSLTGVQAIAAGTASSHSLALKNGVVYSTGSGGSGQLGLGGTSSKSTFTQVPYLSNVTQIAEGAEYSAALKSDGTLWVTGRNYYGSLGLGDYLNRTNFVQTLDGVSQVGCGAYTTYAVRTDETLSTVGSDSYGQAATSADPEVHVPTQVLTDVRQSVDFTSPGTISALKINAGQTVGWNQIGWTGSQPVNTQIKFRTRGAADEGSLDLASWSDYYTDSGASITTAKSQWLEIELILSTGDGIYTPTLNDFTVSYFTDISPPNNPINAGAWNDDGKGTAFTTDTWIKDDTPYFEWSGATDNGEAGVAGYYVYLGTDDTADPVTTSGILETGGTPHYQSGTSLEVSSEMSSDTTYYLLIKTKDNALNVSTDAANLFTYKYDGDAPQSPLSINVSPSGYTRANNYTFSWATSGANGPSDTGGSDLAGYQYKTGAPSGQYSSWSNTINQGSIELSDVAYQTGPNIFYLRAIDNAGNVDATPVQSNFYYNAAAPTAPRSLTASPATSEGSPAATNSFSFSWTTPASYEGTINGYYYSINALPTLSNATYTTGTSLTTSPYATQQGKNTLYLVAKDEAGNYSFESCANIQGNEDTDSCAKVDFYAQTSAPGTPAAVQVFDISNRDTKEYATSLKWTEPSNKGTGFAGYEVYRSTDNQNFSVVGTTSSNSYADTGLQSTPYYYYVKSKDNAGQRSAVSSTESILPTGRYTKPPGLTGSPDSSPKAFSATVAWETDRESSSFVEYGTNPGKLGKANGGDTVGQLDKATKHIVTIKGLEPSKTYYYQSVWIDGDGNQGASSVQSFITKDRPKVSDVKITNIALNSATINWTSTTIATTAINYGKNTNYGGNVTEQSGSMTSNHSVNVTNLDDSSTYHMQIVGTDTDENNLLSDDYTFTTLTRPQTRNLRFESVKDAATTSLKFTWSTNIPTTSVVLYSQAGGASLNEARADYTTDHDVTIANLADHAVYSLQVKGVDQHGNTTVSDVNTFTTPNDTRPPKMSNMTMEVKSSGLSGSQKSQIIVKWETDEPATSQVEYGNGIASDNYSAQTSEDMSYSLQHMVILNDLEPAKLYHLRAVSNDSSGNKGKSVDTTVITGKAQKSVIDLIVNSLEKSLGFLTKLPFLNFGQ